MLFTLSCSLSPGSPGSAGELGDSKMLMIKDDEIGTIFEFRGGGREPGERLFF